MIHHFKRVRELWNKLPISVKDSCSVDEFKCRLESFKNDCIKGGHNSIYYYWNISDVVLSKIETVSYLENRQQQVDYLKTRPFLSKKRFFNLRY